MQPKFSVVQDAYNTEKLSMTNTQNVTELQPRMTREQLVDAARTAAKYLPVASAQLMNELATRLDYTSVALCESMEQRKKLAGENMLMIRLLTDISENHGEFVNEDDDYLYASVPMDYVSEINAHVSRDVNAENPFSVTDSIICGIRSEGVNFAASRIAAAFNNGFINKPITEVSDVVKAILTSKEELSNEPATDGLSGEYAERALKDWASKINDGDQ